MNLFEELKRRNVFKVALVYTIAGWLVMQVVDVMFPALNLPDWTVTLIAALLIIGFPFALIFAWVYELTPEGLKLERDIDRSGALAGVPDRKLNYLIAVLLVVAIGVMLANRFWPAEEAAGTEGGRDLTAPVPALAEDGRPVATDGVTSVAVLPFVNMSPDPDNEFFSDGISEELLNVLVKVEGLRVPSRTSSFAFKGREMPITEIANELNVDHVLEGSVRKAGNKVRVTAQLIDVKTDTHLWSDTYDRELSDIFEIQDEIAQNIVGALEATLGVQPAGLPVGEQPTENLEAYELFLQGRHLFLQRGVENLERSIGLLEQAVELDPEFARAWAVLAAARQTLPYYALTPHRESLPAVEAAARRALELDDGLGEAWATLGSVAVRKNDVLQSMEYYRRGIAAEPRNSTVRLWYGLNYLIAGKPDKAREQLEMAVRLDPASGINNDWLGRTYVALGREEEGRKMLERAEALGRRAAPFMLFRDGLLRMGGLDEALAYIESWRDRLPDPFIEAQKLAYRARSDPQARAELLEFFDGIPFEPPTAYRFDAYTMAGDYDRALVNIERIAAADNTAFWVFWSPWFSELRQHPDFKRLMHEYGFVDYWEVEGYPEMCRRVGDSFECD